MNDRTMVLLALIFLSLTIGAGVNRSLEACNRMVGEELCPGIGDLCREKLFLAAGRVMEVGIPAVADRVDRVKSIVSREINGRDIYSAAGEIAGGIKRTVNRILAGLDKRAGPPSGEVL
ncbi:MAG: hypothetical protein CVU89_02670 [Firmicutes bacterium HGW-Firmicutes-14]|nr:MAG: hypothetical protein CVU89_02670 [Firmicutes bacterium HGW-Firmicutes-14]